MSFSRHRYRVFGLSLACDAAIPGLPAEEADGEADVTVVVDAALPPRARADRVRHASEVADGSGTPVVTVSLGRSGYRFEYAEGAEFLIDVEGRHIRCRWTAPLMVEDAAIYLLGPVLGLLLRLRGTVPLHASAVEIGGRALLFAGEGEAGKSTTAAAFAALGHGVLSDDIVPIHERGPELLACPGHPRVGVWPDAVAGLFGSPAALPRLSGSWDKRHLDVCGPGYRFGAAPVPIEAICLLGVRVPPGEAPSPRRLAPREALVALVTHTYGNYLLDARMRARELDVLARVATRVPVVEMAIEDGVERLPEFCRRLAPALPVSAACHA